VDFQTLRDCWNIIARDLLWHLPQNRNGRRRSASQHPEFVMTPATLYNGEFSMRSSVGSDHSRIQERFQAKWVPVRVKKTRQT
jgi:hypothetical protein